MSVVIPPLLPGETNRDRGLLYVEVLVRQELEKRQRANADRKLIATLLTEDLTTKKPQLLALLDADIAERDAEIAAFDAEAAAAKADMQADRTFAQAVRKQVNNL